MSDPKTPMAEGDDALQAVVIWHLIDVHWVTLVIPDLVRELGHPHHRTEWDEIRLAVRELAKFGLLEEEGERVRPSRAAVRYHELTEYMP